MFGRLMEYKLVRMKRKTLTISVSDGAVTVKAPKSKDIALIENFVAQKSAWIQKKLDEQARRAAALGGVTDYTKIMLDGVALNIAASDKHKKICCENGVVYIPTKYMSDDAAKKRAVAAWYKRGAKTLLSERLASLSQATGLSYASFALTNAATKWGSCDGECNIRLNWRLVMLDGSLADYVIVHELAHTVHHNHSAAFWSVVGRFCPDYKQKRKSLKAFAPLTALYR